MPYVFHETENTGEKCEWCRENIGCDGKGWEWALKQGKSYMDTKGNVLKYEPTSVFITIENELDATAYKLRWI